MRNTPVAQIRIQTHHFTSSVPPPPSITLFPMPKYLSFFNSPRPACFSASHCQGLYCHPSFVHLPRSSRRERQGLLRAFRTLSILYNLVYKTCLMWPLLIPPGLPTLWSYSYVPSFAAAPDTLQAPTLPLFFQASLISGASALYPVSCTWSAIQPFLHMKSPGMS